MPRYERRQVPLDDEGGFEIDGEVLAVLDAPRTARTITALIELPATVTCGAPKSDGQPCEREVDGPGERCWQHTDEE